jgi:hypothetical protein
MLYSLQYWKHPNKTHNHPADSNLQNHHHQNLKSHMALFPPSGVRKEGPLHSSVWQKELVSITQQELCWKYEKEKSLVSNIIEAEFKIVHA